MSKWIKKLTEAYSEVNVNENKKMATAKALAKSTASSEKGKAAVTLPKAPFDIPKKADKMPIAKKDVNELNKSTLGSYIKKAHPDAASQASSATKLAAMGADTDANKASKKAKNRTAGIATAADKLAKEAMDPVNHKALKGKHKDRDDTDIDNDGDTDSSDKYLHKRRKAISKNVKDGDEVEMNPKLNKKAKGAATSKGDAEMAESTLPSVYARILENRAAHYKKAAPAQDKEDGLSPMAKKAKADMEAGAKMDDTEEKGHVDAAKAGRAGPGRKPRRNDNMKGDKAIISSATKMKEAFRQVSEYTAHGGKYNPKHGNDEGITAGKGKLDKQYHKAEAHVSSKHGSNGMAYAHHKGDTAVSALTGDESGPYSHNEGSSSLGNHDTHNITAVVHKDGSTSGVNLKYGQRATHHDVMKQAPKVHHSLAKKIAHEHNSAAAKVTD